jgi:hypothetical protein
MKSRYQRPDCVRNRTLPSIPFEGVGGKPFSIGVERDLHSFWMEVSFASKTFMSDPHD